MRMDKLPLVLCLLTATAQAGVVLHVGSRDLPSGKAAPHELYYAQNGMMRVDTLGERNKVTQVYIVRDGVIWDIDPQQRTYSRIDQAALKAFIGDRQSQMDAMIANLPPAQRAMMQERVAKMHDPHQAKFTDTGRSEQSGPYSCRVWQEQHDARPYAEYCVVPATSLPGGSELATSMHTAIETANRLVSGIPQLAMGAEHLTRLDKLHGFPVTQRFLSSSGQAEREDVLTSVETIDLPADKFAIPQGFTEKTMGEREND